MSDKSGTNLGVIFGIPGEGGRWSQGPILQSRVKLLCQNYAGYYWFAGYYLQMTPDLTPDLFTIYAGSYAGSYYAGYYYAGYYYAGYYQLMTPDMLPDLIPN